MTLVLGSTARRSDAVAAWPLCYSLHLRLIAISIITTKATKAVLESTSKSGLYRNHSHLR